MKPCAACWSMVLVAAAVDGGQRPAPARALKEPSDDWPPPEDREVPLFDDLGDMTMSVGAKPDAQAYFDQGLRLIASFDFNRAVTSFRCARRRDPGCVMCIWGEALALGPSLNSFDELALVKTVVQAHQLSMEALRRSEEEGSAVAPRDQALIRALTLRFGTSVEDHLEREKALALDYAEAMAEMYVTFGPDTNLAALTAEGWLLTSPWDYWERPGKARPASQHALDVVRAALLLDPRHPFCVHLFVHITEASGDMQLIQEAVPYASVLQELIPGSPHLVHMNFHTLMHVGDYSVSATNNNHASSMPRQVYPMHNLDCLAWSCRAEGRSHCALAAAGRLRSVSEHIAYHGVAETGFPAVRFAVQELLTQIAFGMGATILNAVEPPMACNDAYACGIWHFARGVSLAKAGDVAAALLEHDALEVQQQRVAASLEEAPDWEWKNFNGSKEWALLPVTALLDIASSELQAACARARGFPEAELAAWRSAWLGEAALPYDEPPAWYLPVGLRYGDALSRAGRVDEATAVFNETLSKYPHHGWALFGLLQLCRQSQDADCIGIERRFDAAWQLADVELASAADVAGPTKVLEALVEADVQSHQGAIVSSWTWMAWATLGAAGLWIAPACARNGGLSGVRRRCCAGHYESLDGGLEASQS